jgi:hypothetical protein
MKMNSIIKDLLRRIIVVVILLIVKKYINLDLINDSVDNLIIAISTFLWDFNLFTSEITKGFFNGNNGDEGEGSNRQNNPQGSSIDPPSSWIEGGVVVSGEELEQVKALFEKNSEFFGKTDEILDEIMKFDNDQKQLAMEEVRILEERKIEINIRIRDLEDLKNQGESEENLSDIRRQLAKDGKALYEDYRNLKDKAHTHKAEVNKMYSELISKAGEIMRDSTNESNSK